MPMMIVSDEIFEAERNKLSNNGPVNDSHAPHTEIVTSLDLFKKSKGRPAGSIEIPSSIRALVAEEAICGASPNDISKVMGVSKSSISAYKNDATSCATYNKPDKELKTANDELRDSISTSARSKLMMALDNITEEKVSSAKLRDVAGVAQAMSAIVRNMEPAGPQVQVNNQVVVYRPRQNEMEDFEVITVNE